MYTPHFHVGILVRDIEAAAADFTRLLGVEWEPTRSGTVATGELTRYRYSRQEHGPYLELMEMTGSGLWGPEAEEGLHHLAFGVDDVTGSCRAFDGETTTIVDGESGPRVVFTAPEALHGVRVEFLEAAMAASTIERLRG